MRILELYCGYNHSFSKWAREKGHTAVTVDSEPRTNPDILADMMTWDYKAADLGNIDMLWASPPCRCYSIARTRKKTTPEEYVASNALVNKALEIIDYVKPRFWVIENPQTGLLKDQGILDEFEFCDVDQCMYVRGSRKRTRL